MIPLLTVIFSFMAAAFIGFLPESAIERIRANALIASISGLLVSLFCYFLHDFSNGNAQQLIDVSWISALGVSFKIGVDGLNLPLLVLTGIVSVCGVLFSWNLKHRANSFYAFYFTLIGGVYGVFISLDLFLLFVFYEIAIVPKYFIIAIWGSGKKGYAAMKLVLYSFAGSAVALLGLLAIYHGSGIQSFDVVRLMNEGQFSETFQVVVFPIVFLGFAILAGMWPFHTWAPTGHVAAPTAASMLLAGVVMKLGAYGCLRVGVGLLPEGAQYWAPIVALIAVINILYGALVALVQRDFKFVIGYSSVSHMGFVLLGLAALNEVGLTGVMLQMFSHGVIGALLFALVGSVIYSRTHTRELSEFDRLIDRMPGIAWLFIVAGLASMGLPGFSGFMAELHVLVGIWKQDNLSVWVMVLAGLGILMTFAYILVKVHEALFRKRGRKGTEDPPSQYPLMTITEKLGCGILLGFAILIGIFPALLTDLVGPSLEPVVESLKAAAK